MGIPSYFSYIIKNYSNTIRSLTNIKQTSTQFEHLLMDCNSIIYDSVAELSVNIDSVDDFEKHVIDLVCIKIETYIQFICPTTTVFITFDGVAPFAKMKQQKTRRLRNAFLNKLTKPNSSAWDTSLITPGTDFMNALSKAIYSRFYAQERKYCLKKILISCSDQPGEGEHKLFAEIRTSLKGNSEIAVYGLDSDLIMLSIFHLKYCKNIHVFRETPEFLKQLIDTNSPNEPHFIDIQALSKGILQEMACDTNPVRIYDYVFLCFFLGNDFLPHFPSMNIRTHGMNVLLDLYRSCIGRYPERSFVDVDTDVIHWKCVGLFVSAIAKREHEFFIREYFTRNSFEKRNFLENTPEEKIESMNNIPVIYRGIERYICPDEPFWENRYYSSLFHVSKTHDSVKKISMNYLEGLEWVYKYYTVDCVSWKWKYEHCYPPLFCDLCKFVPTTNMTFFRNSFNNKKVNQPMTNKEQLDYVLPKNYNLDNVKLEWAFCRYLWEAHVREESVREPNGIQI